MKSSAIVAHSWGSSVALAASLQAPERVTRIALYDAWVYEEQLPTFFHWARADGVGEALFGLYYKERADERMALAFFDKKYVTERLVESVDEALDRPGTLAAALAAVRGQDYADAQRRYGTHRQADAPHVGPRGHRHAAPLRRAPLARSPAVEARRLSALRPLPDDRGARRLEPRPRAVPRRAQGPRESAP